MPVTRDELLVALQKKDPNADLYESVDPRDGRIAGIVITSQFQDEPDIVRSQRMGKYLRGVFGERAVCIGTLTVFSPSEKSPRVAG